VEYAWWLSATVLGWLTFGRVLEEKQRSSSAVVIGFISFFFYKLFYNAVALSPGGETATNIAHMFGAVSGTLSFLICWGIRLWFAKRSKQSLVDKDLNQPESPAEDDTTINKIPKKIKQHNWRFYFLLSIFSICLLIVAWAFRWEHGPTLNKDNLTIIYTKDRWTQQTWMSLYGTEKNKVYSGDTLPAHSENEVKYRAYQILKSPENVQKRRNYEDLAREAEKNIKQYELGHAKYIDIVDSLQQRENRARLARVFEYLRHEEYEHAIPQKFIDDNLNWIAQNKLITDSKSGIKKLEEQAEAEAKSTLDDRAYLLRSITTIIWAFLLLLSSILAIVLLRKGFFSKQEGEFKS